MLPTALAWASHGVDLIQLRAKDWGAGRMLALTQALLPALREQGIPLIINDRLDLALVSGADGVHLGQEDLPAAEARALLGPDRLLGWSTHDAVEVAEAPPEADYLGFGAIYPTLTRKDSRVGGPEALTGITEATTLPIFAIGGIDAENLLPLGVYRIAGVAVASALRGSPSEAALRFRRALAHWS
jgi:thiamine-phosphate pyrophosphorylase